MRLGMHFSLRKGFLAAFESARDLGCETFQTFTLHPRGWRGRKDDLVTMKEFAKRHKSSGLFPYIHHAPFLPSLASVNERFYERSLKRLVEDLERAEILGATYLVVHAGPYSQRSTPEQGIERFQAALNHAIAKAKSQVVILVENLAGGGRKVGVHWKELKEILSGVEAKSRVAVCLDVMHAYAAGYPVHEEKGLEKTLEDFDKIVGQERLKVMHLCDAGIKLGGHKDIHTHLGEGHMGLEALGRMLRHAFFKDCAVILETPKDTPEADQKNMALARKLLKTFMAGF